jgi:sodium/proline symporter
MFFAIIIVPIIAINNLGSISNVISSIRQANPELLNMLTTNSGEKISIITILSLFGWGLGYFGQPHILARFMAVNNSDQLKKARKIAMLWVVISLVAAVILGMVGFVSISPELNVVDSEKVFIILVGQLVNPLVSGILLAAILAAIMSTADSQLLVASSSLVEDIYKPFFRPNASQKELLWVSRGFVLLIALIALAIGLNPNSSVLDLVSYAWAGFGATFGPIIFLSLYWKNITEEGAIAGMVTGGITILIWKQLTGGIFDLYEMVPGFLISTMIIIIVSKISTNHHLQNIENEFNKIKA